MVTLYATLGEDAIAHGINETEVSIVITTHELLPKIKNILHMTPKVQTVIYMEDQLHPTDTKCSKSNVDIIPFQRIVDTGKTSSIGEYCTLHLHRFHKVLEYLKVLEVFCFVPKNKSFILDCFSLFI